MIKQRSNLTLPVSLYAIGNVKDELNLHTGELTHRIGKVELTGDESFNKNSSPNDNNYLYYIWNNYISENLSPNNIVICDRLPYSTAAPTSTVAINSVNSYNVIYMNFGKDIMNAQSLGNNINGFKEYLRSEYQAGHPVTIWYVLAEPTTETVTVPEGLSGIIEGYLIQDSTPTPQNPIYPTSCDSVDMWNEIMYRQYGVNETLSPIPSTVFSQGDGIDSCTVYGNTVQNGTPTPTDPVDVTGVGDVSRNLFDLSTATIGKYINSSGIETDTTASGPSRLNHTDYIAIIPNTTYTYTCYGTAHVANTIAINWFDNTKQLISRKTMDTLTIPEYSLSDTSPANAVYCIINFTGYSENLDNRFMFNIGSSSLPYEPYGYKVGLDIDSQITNIYLGTFQSIRQIQKLVLTGNETWTYLTGSKFWTTVTGYMKNGMITVCTHYIGTANASGSASFLNGTVGFYNTNNRLIICDTSFNDETTFKQYLQQQYQAGTPVTVYYVLATPQTTTLNEPLMKIGDYADSVTYSSNIPTTYGQNDITTDTQIKPSKLDITYNALRRAKVYKNNRWILNPSIDWSQTLKISDLQSKKIKEMEGEYIGYNIHT